MFICDICHRQQEKGIKPIRLPRLIRKVKYINTTHYLGSYSFFQETEHPTEKLTESEGFETVQEVNCCPKCAQWKEDFQEVIPEIHQVHQVQSVRIKEDEEFDRD